jgi:hypothetical protein
LLGNFPIATHIYLSQRRAQTRKIHTDEIHFAYIILVNAGGAMAKLSKALPSQAKLEKKKQKKIYI